MRAPHALHQDDTRCAAGWERGDYCSSGASRGPCWSNAKRHMRKLVRQMDTIKVRIGATLLVVGI